MFQLQYEGGLEMPALKGLCGSIFKPEKSAAYDPKPTSAAVIIWTVSIDFYLSEI
jgi:hypothetical protein